MNRARSVLSVALAVALIVALASAARGQMGPTMPVRGTVIDAAGRPMGGLTVQLMNQQIGPSTPSITNAQGLYYFANVPVNAKAPYIIEIRWGSRTIFRDYVHHLGQQEVIRLR
jgi:hypothetical protein